MRRLALALLLALPASARAQQSVMNTKHNLSVSGPGPIKAESETQVCIFCHVPHGGGARGLNRPLSGATYTPYSSSTMVSPAPGAPTGASRICLSCHDGTIALGQTLASGTIATVNTTGAGALPAGASNLGTDLSRSHPVSFVPALSPALHAPAPGDPVQLDSAGRLQCTSCHNPHEDGLDPVQGKFLVKSNRASALCTTCHVITSWLANPSAHQASTKFYDTSLGATTPYTTVADNACESCHRPHGATSGTLNLKDATSQVCMPCHTAGKVAAKDLSQDFGKSYVHPALSGNPALHDEAEGPASATHPLPETSASALRHVQCVDCHNPHAAYAQTQAAPVANGTLAGVWGIDRNGNRVSPVVNEYEVCFKCHADSANQPQAAGPTPPETVQRLVTEVNLRRALDLTSAPSFHPVEGPGRSTTVPGLVAPLTASSVIYCSDCHASDQSPAAGRTGAAGPHGSIYPHILARNLSTLDNTTETADAYALCYGCHDRATLLSTASGFTQGGATPVALHQTHVGNDTAPCSACHDWHGVSSIQGNLVSNATMPANTTNNAHLINFDVSIVQPSGGTRQYTSTGAQHGNCTLTCHSHVHTSSSY